MASQISESCSLVNIVPVGLSGEQSATKTAPSKCGVRSAAVGKKLFSGETSISTAFAEVR